MWKDPSSTQPPKILPLYHRMPFDERNKGIHRSAHSRGDGGLVESLYLG